MPDIRDTACKLCDLSYKFPLKPKSVCIMAPDEEIKECDVMIVSSGVLIQDDHYNKPFSASILQKVRNIFLEAGFSVYTTYATKCLKTEKTAKIKPQWVKTCAENFLHKEIERVKPKHIVCLGSDAWVAVNGPKPTWSKGRGARVFNDRWQANLYATVSAASAVFNLEQRTILFKEIVNYIDWIKNDVKEDAFNPEIEVIYSIKRLKDLLREMIDANVPTAFDIETTSKDAYDPDQDIRSIQFSFDDRGFVLPIIVLQSDISPTNKFRFGGEVWTQEQLERIGELLNYAFERVQCIWHNGKFDRQWLHEWGIRELGFPILAPNIVGDTMHLAGILDENRELRLKSLITQEFGWPTYDIGDKVTPNLEELYPYAGKDTVATLYLFWKYCEDLKAPGYEKLRKLYTKVLRKCDTIFTKMELRGWPVSKEVALVRQGELTKQSNDLEDRMRDILEKSGVTSSVNFASPTQLAVTIFEDLKLLPHQDKAIAFTPTGLRCTKEDAIYHLKYHPFISALLEWRGLQKALATYIRPMIKAADGRGRLATSYKLVQVVTGRTASSANKEGRGGKAEGMNLQNMPNDKPPTPTNVGRQWKIKTIIRCKPGYSLIDCDLSQIELRVAGELSKDPFLNYAYRNGKDLHTLRAARMKGMSEEEWIEFVKINQESADSARTDAKPVNFGFLYGMSARKFQNYALVNYDVTFTLDQCNRERRRYFEDHTGLPAWYDEVEAEGIKKGYVESLTGRRRRLLTVRLNDEGSQEARIARQGAVRQLINFPVQNFASEWKLMSIVEINEYLEENYTEEEAHLIGEVHDSIITEAKSEFAEEIARNILRIMKRPKLVDELGIIFSMPVGADAKIGQSLGELKKIKL